MNKNTILATTFCNSSTRQNMLRDYKLSQWLQWFTDLVHCGQDAKNVPPDNVHPQGLYGVSACVSLLTLHIMLNIILFSIISTYSISNLFGAASTGYLPGSPLIGSQKHSILVNLNSMKLSPHGPSLCYCTLHQRFLLPDQLAAKRKTCKHVVTTKTFGYVYCTR
jgi:hypothetical protein